MQYSVTSALETGSPGIVGVLERVGVLALLWGEASSQMKKASYPGASSPTSRGCPWPAVGVHEGAHVWSLKKFCTEDLIYKAETETLT